MSKEEFLRILRIKISGSMAPQEVESQIDYYSAYIDGEIMKGRTEFEVVEELGDPTLIAKTLTAAMKRSNEEMTSEENYYSDSDYNNETEEGPQNKTRVFKASGAGCIIAFIVVLIIIFLLIFLIIKFSFTIIGFLWPVILVLVIGGLIFGLIRRK